MHLVTFERSSDHSTPNASGTLGDAAMGFESLEPVRPGSRRLGAVISIGTYAGWLVDLNRSLAIKLAYDDVGAPEVEADSMVPSDMLSFLRLGPAALELPRLLFATPALVLSFPAFAFDLRPALPLLDEKRYLDRGLFQLSDDGRYSTRKFPGRRLSLLLGPICPRVR